jgi:hypothetical protein
MRRSQPSSSITDARLALSRISAGRIARGSVPGTRDRPAGQSKAVRLTPTPTDSWPSVESLDKQPQPSDPVPLAW